jgi:5'-deoxynucleotidase YfbR-like HD superfamily hydrolase
MREQFEWLKAIRKGGDVTRYHTEPTLGPQSVGSHSWGVALIVMALEPGNVSTNLLQAALVHDISEYWTGDTPANVKWNNDELVSNLKNCENFVNEVLGINFLLDAREKQILEFADKLELLLYCLEQRRMGNQNVDLIVSRVANWWDERGIEHKIANSIYNDILIDYEACGGIFIAC